MNIILKLNLLILIIGTSNLSGQAQLIKSIDLSDCTDVGYIDNTPIIHNMRTNALYKLNDSLVPFLVSEKDYEPLRINDRFAVFVKKEGQTYHLIVKKIYGPIIYCHSNNHFYTYCALTNDGNFYFTDNLDNDNIKLVTNQGVIKIGIKGNVIYADSLNMVYSKEKDNGTENPNDNIYRYNTETKKICKIADNVAGDADFIFDDGKYLFDRRLNGGGFRPIVFDICNKKFEFVKVKKEYWNHLVFYYPERNALVFYSNEKKNILFVPIKEIFAMIK